MSIATTYNNNVYFVSLTGETTYAIPSRNSRSSICIKNLSSPDVTCTCWTGETADGLTSFTLKGYCAIEMIRGTTEWVIVRSYDKNEEVNAGTIGEEATIAGAGELTPTGGIYAAKAIISGSTTASTTPTTGGIIGLGGLGVYKDIFMGGTTFAGPTATTTTTAVGAAFANQPANDGVTVVSADAADTTQTVTIIGTTHGGDVVVTETVTLNGDTAVNTVKTDWGIILAVKKSAVTAGTVTVSETSGAQTITAGLTAAVLTLGVTAVAAGQQGMYGRVAYLVASGASTKQIGLKGANLAGTVSYDSQALAGTVAVSSNTAFDTITEIYTGDVEGTVTATVYSNSVLNIKAGTLQVNGASLGLTKTAYGVGTAYQLTNTAAAIDFGTTDPSIVLTSAGTYLIMGQVNLTYTGATVVAETATIKVRRTNNTAADLSAVVVLDPPVATTLTNTFGTFTIPPFVYTTTAVDDAVTIFGNVSAALGAGTIDATGIGTSLVALRLY